MQFLQTYLTPSLKELMSCLPVGAVVMELRMATLFVVETSPEIAPARKPTKQVSLARQRLLHDERLEPTLIVYQKQITLFSVWQWKGD